MNTTQGRTARNGKAKSAKRDSVTQKAVDAEQQVVGSLLIDETIVDGVLKIVGPSDFFDPYHARVMDGILSLRRKGTPLSPITLHHELSDEPLFGDTVPLVGYLVECGESVPHAAHWKHYATLVKTAAIRRQMDATLVVAAEGLRDGQETGRILADLSASLVDVQAAAVGDDEAIAHLHDAREPLSDGEPISYLVPGVLPAHEFGVIAAKSKSLKTKTALDMAIGLATATNFLHHWEIMTPKRVYMLSMEIRGSVLDSWVEDIAKSKKRERCDLEYLILDDETKLNLTSDRGLGILRRIIERHDIEAAIIDPANYLLPGVDMNSLPDMTLHLNRIKAVSDDTGCSICVIHHNRKNSRDQGNHFGPPSLEDIHGSGFSQVARHWMLLNRRREWEPEQRTHYLHLVAGGSAGHATHKWYDATEGRSDAPGGTYWETSVLDPAEGMQAALDAKETRQAQQEAQKWQKRMRDCCDALAEAHGPLSKTAMCQRAKLSTRYREDVVEMLLDEGHAVLVEGGKFKLAEE